jgi:hypothetical protein
MITFNFLKAYRIQTNSTYLRNLGYVGTGLQPVPERSVPERFGLATFALKLKP